MFAVPGWSVSSADLKTQLQDSIDDAKPEKTENGAGINKRKRGNQSEKVTPSNVDKLWKKHIEEIPSKGKDQQKGKDKKRRKLESESKGADEAEANQSSTKNSSRKQDMKGNGAREDEAGKTSVKDRSAEDGETNGARPVQNDADALEEKKKKRRERQRVKRQRKRDNEDENEETPKEPALETTTAQSTSMTEGLDTKASVAEAPALTPLQQSMRQKLLGARFRHLNETLYTSPSSKALQLFTESPGLFAEYHAGFAHQVQESWPSNPVDAYIDTIKKRGARKPTGKSEKEQKYPGAVTPLPRRPNGMCTVADLGCGDAKLARTLLSSAKAMKLRFDNFDLYVGDKLITKSDIASLPLGDGTVDVAIFCLSLMGTNWISFIEEAWRVLRGDGKGECWVSEVKSRFGKVARKNQMKKSEAPAKKDKKKKKQKQADEDVDADDKEIFAEDYQDDGDETDISAFVEVFRARGFALKPESVDKSNKMFVKMEFVKRGIPTKGKWAGENKSGKKFIEPEDTNWMTLEEESKVLKPCVYKTR